MIATLLAEAPWLVRVVLLALVGASSFAAYWLSFRRGTTWIVVWLSGVAIASVTLIPGSSREVTVCVLPVTPTELLGPEPTANVLLFVPFALALAVLLKRPVIAFLAGTGASMVIELAQWFVPAIGRSCSSTDWIANTLGAFLGAGFAALGLWVAVRRTDPRLSGAATSL
jgi:hypothetical protein